MKLKLNPNTVM